ncbi:MAG: hypothetical protein IJE68_06450 [Clostridia bacterium]|nr:hypothetical protein [Clostridia bacterium]
MKTMYIEKMDKPKLAIQKIKIEGDNCKIYLNLEKERNIKKSVNKLLKNEVANVVLSKELLENQNLINALNASNINVFDGRWLEKHLSIQILDYIVQEKNIKKEETEIAITANQITDFSIEIIKCLAKQYKKLTAVTNNIEKLRKIEKEIYDKEGILIVVSNNQKKSLLKAQIILNVDFNKTVLNKYRINENAVIVNLEGDMKINEKRFNGINVNDYEIEVGREEIIWRKNMKKFKTKDLLEAHLYMKDTFSNVCKKIRKNKVFIKELYGLNGKIERFS